MNIELVRKNKAFHFEATDSSNQKVQIDAGPKVGGEDKGTRPMDLLLMALGGCSSIDIGLILKKQKQELEDFKVQITADREDAVPSLFKKINLHFILWGDLKEKKVIKSIELSLEKYCSVAKILEPTAEITYSFEIRNN
ncbi:MAG: OsmC family protein [Flavobacteriales bacterium]|nr:OsmC family protein [Flavobacteriales bacterium]